MKQHPSPEKNWSGSKKACQEICDQINEYWAARGLFANARPEKVIGRENNPSNTNYWGVRSDMFNGAPAQELSYED